MVTMPQIRDRESADGFKVLARNMVAEVEHPKCGPIKLVNTPVKYSFSEPSIRTPPPTLGELQVENAAELMLTDWGKGQHTDEVLREMVGLSESEIESLRSEGVVA